MFGMSWRNSVRDEWLVAFLAGAIGIYSQLPALSNPYTVGGDFRGTFYWIRQLHDNTLFPNDFLTEHYRYFQQWGVVGIYYGLSFLIEPLVISKILPIFLLALSSFYLFKLVRHFANPYGGFLAAVLFMTSFTYLDRIAGGVAGSFSFPLLIVFLYYLAKKDYLKASFLLILQVLFYPVIFFISAITYFSMFIKIGNRKISFDPSSPKVAFFVLGVFLSISFFYGKYVLVPKPFPDRLVTRSEMIGQPEYYEGGRNRLLPVLPLSKELGRNIRRGLFTRKFLRENPLIDTLRTAELRGVATFMIVAFLLIFLWKVGFSFPQELFSLFLASIAMYRLSDWLLPRLYYPSRYLEYSLPLMTLILFAAAVGKGMERLRSLPIRKLLQIVTAGVLVFFNCDLGRATSVNMSSYADLYSYLRTLPKNALIAAHPELAAGIPTFAMRKVFIHDEAADLLSHRYWKMFKKRTSDFFDAYYAEGPSSVYQFCKENQIDYLVVNEKHFEDDYLNRGQIYFEPFNTYVKKRVGGRAGFALREVPDGSKLFSKNGLFVVHCESLRLHEAPSTSVLQASS
jgi:hypothetical protein